MGLSIVRKLFGKAKGRYSVVYCCLQLVAFSLFAQAPPAITSISPVSAAVGAAITITGNNFNTDPTKNIVFFGATRANVVAATATEINVLVPSGASHGLLTVLNTTTQLVGYSPKYFLPLFNGGGASSSFASKTDFTTAAYPFRVATGDFNDDGKPDVVTLNQIGNSLSVFKNTSIAKTISFDSKTDYPTENMPQEIAEGDINRDGKLDIVICYNNSSLISVFLNTSTGGLISFAAKADFSGTLPVSIAINDVDMDGKPDIVATNPGGINTVTIFRNTGTQANLAFTTVDIPSGGGYPMNISALDLNGDGKPELALLNQLNTRLTFFENHCTPGSVSFISSSMPVSISAPLMVAGDIDGDGKTDLVTTNTTASAFYVMRNVTTDTLQFTFNSTPLSPTGMVSTTTNDFNGDGKADIAISNGGSQIVSVIQNNSTPGSFAYGNKTTMPASSTVQGMTNADIDGDGKPDLLVVNAGANTVSVFRNATSSTPPTITSFAPLSGGAGSTLTITESDFDDVIDVKFGGTSATSFTVVSSTAILATVGNGSSGAISVTTAGGTGGVGGFIFLPPPTITSFTPGGGISGTVVTIQGTNFSNISSVRWRSCGFF